MKLNSKKIVKNIFSFKVLATIAILILSYQVYSMHKVISPVQNKSEGIIDEINAYRQNNSAFASDLNEIRQYLLLPTKDYANDEFKQPTDEDLKAAILSFMGSVGHDADKIEKLANLKSKVQSTVDDAEFKTVLAENGLSAFVFEAQYDGDNTYDLLALKIDEQSTLANVKANVADATFFVESFGEQTGLGADLKTELINLIKTQKSNWVTKRESIVAEQNYLKTYLASAEIADLFKQKALRFDEKPTDTLTAYVYKIDAKYGKVLDLGIDKKDLKIFINNNGQNSVFEDHSNFENAFVDAIKSVDLRSPIEKLVEQKKSLLDSMFMDDSFKIFLKGFGGEMSSDAKEEADRYVYSLSRGGNLLGSIILEKGTAKIKVLRKGDGFAVDVFDFSTDTKKKT